MRAVSKVLAHVPKIQFVGGPHKVHVVPAGVHPCAPDGLLPAKLAASSSPVAAGFEFQSRNSLSKRFQYRRPDELEMDNVLSGGADVIYKQLF